MKEACFWDDPSYRGSEPLRGSEQAEFLIVGAGVAGLFVAHFLLKQGAKNIVVIERGDVGSGSTGHSAGMLVTDLETGPWSKVYGERGSVHAALYFKAQQEALKEIARVVRAGKIDCDLEWRDFLMMAMPGEGVPRLITEFGAQQVLGNKKTRILEGKKLHDEIDTDLFVLGERVDKGISVNPMKFARGLAEYLKERGVKIFESTPLLRVEGNMAITPEGKVLFANLIYSQGTSENHIDLKNVATTIAVTKPLSHKVLAALRLLDRDMFVDTQKPSYHYSKVTPDGRLLVGFGDDEVATTSAVTNLRGAHLVEIEKFLGAFAGPEAEMEYAWTGVFSLSKKILPYVNVAQGKAVLAGMGTQTACVAMAEHVSAMLTLGRHALSPLFVDKNILAP